MHRPRQGMRLLGWTALLTLLAPAAPGAAPGTPSPKSNYDERQVAGYTLPDPLRCEDGTPVRDVATWRERRRPELLQLFATHVYGRTPGGKPAALHWKTTSVDRSALGGKATRKEITVWFTPGTDGPRMHLLVYQPNGDGGPWPVFLGLNYFGNHCVHPDPGITLSSAWMRTSAEQHIEQNRATGRSRGGHASRWQIETVVARGYATATLYYGDLCPDRDDGMTESVGAMFQSGSVNARPPDGWGSIGIWAWGLSRALDCLASDPELDASRVAVHGHSRLGKTALWAGAQDERFALVISNCSGAGGAKLARRNFGESVALSNSRHSTPWYALNYRRYNDNEAALPVDQHQLLALIAPRPLYVASASLDRGADPRGEFLSARHAGPVFELHGQRALGVEEMPPVDQPVGATLRYHVRTGSHDITAYDWAQYLDFADRQLARRSDATPRQTSANAGRPAAVHPTGASAPPYPPSPVIAGIELDFKTHRRLAPGSDNWPTTWADDGHLYSAWGDGGGFGGTNSKGRVLLGVARIAGNPPDYSGRNIWGGHEPEHPAQFGGKSYGILSVGGTLFMWVAPQPNPHLDHCRVAWSRDHGATWQLADWRFEFAEGLTIPTFLNFGRDYAGARDAYVYSYYIAPTWGPGRATRTTAHTFDVHRPGRIFLSRVPATAIPDRSQYEFFSGLDAARRPTWSAEVARKRPVFEDANGVGWNVSVSHNPGLRRYLLATEHTETHAGRFGLFDAPEPWGPWTTVAYDESWGEGHIEMSTFYWNFPAKWLSADGTGFTMVFTGKNTNDSWNTVAGRFGLRQPAK